MGRREDEPPIEKKNVYSGFRSCSGVETKWQRHLDLELGKQGHPHANRSSLP